jgi:hypothetical protein
MNDRILVRGEVSPWLHAGRVISGLAFFIGLAIGAAGMVQGWVLAVCGALIWLALEIVAWQARRVRTWLILHPDGMEFEGPRGPRAIHDSQVTAVALESKKNLSNGELASVSRKFTLWADDQPAPVVMENKLKPNSIDPLAELINRLLERLRERFKDELSKGGAVGGDSWQLSSKSIVLGRSPHEQQIPVSELTAIEMFEGQMCIWRQGNDTAVARLPLGGRNVFLLPALAHPFLSEHQASKSSADTGSLGRVLFERKPRRMTIGLTVFCGLVMLLVGVIVTIAGLMKQDEAAPLIIGIALSIGGPLVSLLGISFAFSSFRCHEQGVFQKNLFGQKTLRYSDVGSFLYSATRHYYNGAYTGTHLLLQFRPASPGQPTIKYGATTHGDDDDLDELRDFISRAIAARMAAQINEGLPVAWTPNLQFLPQGICYRPDGLLGKKDFQLLPYADYGGYDLQQGVFYLFAKGRPKYIASEQASADNFFPGFFLLMLLLHQPVEVEETQAS